MNIEIREFKKDRTVYVSNIIDEASIVQVKKDIQAIMDSDVETMQHNFDELGKLGGEFSNMYMEYIDYPEITLDVTSPGGSVYHGLGLYDFISYINKETAWKIRCVTSGVIASMATIIILSCDERIGRRNTSYMVHSISNLNYGKIQDLRDNMEECERVNKICRKLYKEKTKLTEEKLNEIDKFKKDWWLSAEEALEIGLITKIE